MAIIDTPFINIQTDYGFKIIFGSLDNKNILIRFLNALFEGKLIVNDVVYHDKEVLPSDAEGKRIIYDIYCTSSLNRSESPFFPTKVREDDSVDKAADHHFILEMQNGYTPPFEERMLYYASRIVAAQGRAGWNYDLDPVLTVAVTDFNLGHMSNRLIHDVALCDRITHELLTDKMHLIFCSLKMLPARWEDCRTELERMLFLIKNMDNMTTDSLAYIEGHFAEVFEAARSSRLSDENVVRYSESLEKLREIQAGFRYAADKAHDEGVRQGIEQGMKKGLKQGIEQGARQEKEIMVRNMAARNMSLADIAAIADISIEEVRYILDK